MKVTNSTIVIGLMALLAFSGQAQSNLPKNVGAIGSASLEPCGSHRLMENIDHSHSNYMELSNELMEELTEVAASNKLQKNYQERYIIPVVFHVVHNNPNENIDDSVLYDQLDLLNKSFRRQNADTVDLRSEFHDLVGDAQIEFQLATTDPNGMPTNGITRTSSNIENFGGILPYSPGQNAEINQWVEDSLYYNMFRITQSNLGGSDAWDTQHYLNIWIGDLRIYEPQFNNLEQLFYMGLATAPENHVDWPDSVLQDLAPFHQGVLMHYVNIGSNNPNMLPPPYNAYNGIVTTGKILVHEVGHYLGLRHIWGDGNCAYEDYIDDTPNGTASSNFNCNLQVNSCIDNINGADLPDMVENYMDYSSADCQNSFTIGQNDLMRATLETYRQDLPQVISVASTDELFNDANFTLYPNPSNGQFSVELNTQIEDVQIQILNNLGKAMYLESFQNINLISLDLDMPPGIYFAQILSGDKKPVSLKLIIQ